MKVPRPRSWLLFLCTGVWIPDRRRPGRTPPARGSGKTRAPAPAPTPRRRTGPGTFWHLKPAEQAPGPVEPTPEPPTRAAPPGVDADLRTLKAGLSLATGQPVPPNATPRPTPPSPPAAPQGPSSPDRVEAELARLRAEAVERTPEVADPPVRPRPSGAGDAVRPTRSKSASPAAPSPSGWAELAAWWDAPESPRDSGG